MYLRHRRRKRRICDNQFEPKIIDFCDLGLSSEAQKNIFFTELDFFFSKHRMPRPISYTTKPKKVTISKLVSEKIMGGPVDDFAVWGSISHKPSVFALNDLLYMSSMT